MIVSTVTTLLQTTSAKAATRNQTAPPEKPKPSSTLSATLSRFLAATLFALLFVAQSSNAQGVDASQPTITFTNPTQLVRTAAFTLTGTVTAGATVDVFKDGTSIGAVNVTATTWSVATRLIEGLNAFTATATDADDNTSTANTVITLNTLLAEAPVITVINTVLNNANEQGVICITFDGDVKFDGSPNAAFLNARPGDFVVSSDTSPAPTVIGFVGACFVDSVTHNNTIQLTLNRQIAFGETATLSYTKTGTEHNTKGIRRDLTGSSEPLADFSNKPITNNAIEPIEGLELVSAETLSANQISLSFGLEVVTASSDLRAADFTVSGAASSPMVTGISGLPPSALLLSLDANIVGGETITLSYTKTMGSISGASAGELVSFDDYSVTNHRPLAAPSINITPATVTATVGTAITPITIASTGGTVASYSIEPALPAGLTLDATTGTISGTPTAAANEISYTITATNASDTDTATVAITVEADTTAPTVTITNPTQTVNDAAFTLTGTVEAGAMVNVLTLPPSATKDTGVGNVSMTAIVTDTDWSLDVTLIEGPNVFTVTATDSAMNTSVLAIATITLDMNDAPTANAGDDQTVAEGATVTLDGTGSADPEGETLVYAWTQTSGTDVTLSDSAVASPTFTAPENLVDNAVLEFSLIVTDARMLDSVADTVEVTVTAGTNDAPTANAGDDQTVAEGATVTLDGTGSADPEGETLVYAWTQTSGTDVTLSDSAVASPTFTAPENLVDNAVLEFSLIVTDARMLDSVADTVEVTVTAGTNDAPTANAGDDQTVAEGATVTLDGTGSADPEGETLVYAWTQTSGTDVTLSDSAVASPTFTAPENLVDNAVLEFSLIVTDARMLDSVADTVEVTVTAGTNDAPTITGTATFTIAENSGDGAMVGTITGADVDAGTTLTYSITTGNTNDAFAIDSGTGEITVNGDNKLDHETTPSYSLMVTVSDGSLEATATVTITVTDVDEPAVITPPTGSAAPPILVDPLQLSAARLTVVLGETKEVTISGGLPPYVAPFVSGDLGAVRTSIDGTTLSITGLRVGKADTAQVRLRPQGSASGLAHLEVKVNAPPVLNPGDNDGSGSKSLFRGGASSDGGETYFKDNAFSVGESLNIVFVITPRRSDTGEQVDVVVAARETSAPESVVLLTPSGLVPWDGETLFFFKQDLTLERNSFINLTPEPITLWPAEVGSYELFIGYLLADGELLYHPEPLKIQVAP